MYHTFTRVFTERQTTALVAEADARRPEATPVAVPQARLHGDHAIPASRFRRAGTGPALDAVVTTVVKRVVRDDLGLSFGLGLIPVRTAYNYYDPGDHLGVHLDAPECRYTVLVPLSPQIEPLEVYPALAGAGARELHHRIITGTLGPPVRVPAPYGGLVVVQGSVMPHARPPATHPCRVATVCFG
ncbi:hypothetical protein [Sphaerisporangium aureirubrum]|uniref:Fe2OG dioxygenase domain-containing protein n=1 Tax=Sphaerisporangium aureirubrum TaxID=1544736 RepID=A0ABW1NPB6_9ACTN